MAKSTWTQEQHLLEIETSLGKDKLLLTTLDVHEAISELFSYEIEMLSTDHAITAESLIGDKIKLVIMAETGNPRAIHGGQERTGASRHGLSSRPTVTGTRIGRARQRFIRESDQGPIDRSAGRRVDLHPYPVVGAVSREQQLAGSGMVPMLSKNVGAVTPQYPVRKSMRLCWRDRSSV